MEFKFNWTFCILSGNPTSQPPLQLDVAMWLSSSQWYERQSDVQLFQAWSLKTSLKTGFWASWGGQSHKMKEAWVSGDWMEQASLLKAALKLWCIQEKSFY